MGENGRRGLTRREMIGRAAGALAASLAAARRTAAAPLSRRAASVDTVSKPWDALVVGAGVFGAWTAWHLRKAGQRVLLLDASGPANARASSGGESRMTRTISSE